MFEGLYSNISQKYPKRRDLYDRKVLLEDFLRDEKEFNLKEVIKTFIENLKELLEEDESLLLIEKISLLDGTLKKLKEQYSDEDLPNLEDFYRDLSPVLMQKYWELNLNPPNKEAFEHLFLHSLHIALEEEIYIWQEKIV
ncbi:MAG: hypothetical protein CME60_10215 [Halobacteriovoraceae bacterium]|nr:hypothetical protein [Halobacteriovoraceae bacterium]|tara:strand:+ start:14005 stop:14424 length:420 start_codon:yes stop_codon:yes gene_type:complete